MNNVRTVSDTKRAFYSQHTRPISAIYRRVVEELMVEMHLLLVNVDFNYDALYALGVVSTYDRFMSGYEPERDRDSIYQAIVQAVEADPAQYRRDAEAALSAAKAIISLDSFKSLVDEAKGSADGNILQSGLHQVINNPKFKYSRLFAVGLYNVIEAIDEAVLQDKEKREALMGELADTLGLNTDLLKKDVDLYRSNLEKMAQAQAVMKDMIEAEKKKQAKREEDKRKRAEAKAAADVQSAAESAAAAEPADTAPADAESGSAAE
ncbi:MAG: photosystem II biogenesis protein Psp29 [Cyanobacteria bacterium J06626_6]